MVNSSHPVYRFCDPMFFASAFRPRATLYAVLAALLLACPAGAIPESAIRFRSLGLEEGLSQSVVISLAEDREGFLWIGTQDGLNRYDGLEFEVFRANPSDSTSLPSIFNSTLFADRRGRLWVASSPAGLSVRYPDRPGFHSFFHDPHNPGSLGDERVLSICEDRQGRIWIGTMLGLDRYDEEVESFAHFAPLAVEEVDAKPVPIRVLAADPDGSIWAGGRGQVVHCAADGRVLRRFALDPGTDLDGRNRAPYVTTLYFDNAGRLWMGTAPTGLHRYDREREEFVYVEALDPFLGPEGVIAMVEDRQGQLWISAPGQGLLRYDARTEEVLQLRSDPANPYGLRHDFVRSLLCDRAGNMWAGVGSKGLTAFHPERTFFGHLHQTDSDPEDLPSNMITGLHERDDGSLWIATLGGGVGLYDRQTRTVQQYRSDAESPYRIRSDLVQSVMESSDGSLWIGTSMRGLDRLDPTTGELQSFLPDHEDSTALHGEIVLALHEGEHGEIWIGTNRGLTRLDPQHNTIFNYSTEAGDTPALPPGGIADIEPARAGGYWLISRTWAGRLDPQTQRLHQLEAVSEEGKPFPIQYGLACSESAQGELWITTFGTGVIRLRTDPDSADRYIGRRYTTQSGLPSNATYGLARDDQGMFWFSTNGGLARLDPETEEIRAFRSTDGLQSDEFNQSSYLRCADGWLAFGGVNGLNLFDPAAVRDSPHVPPIVFTDLVIGNESVPLLGRPGAPAAFELDQLGGSVTFRFAALDFTNPACNQFSYLLEGLDTKWIDLRSGPNLTLAGLDAGFYRLRIRGSNADGIWNEEGAAISFTVRPLPWQTWWAKLFCVLSMALVAVGALVAQARKLSKQRQVNERITGLNTRLEEKVDEARVAGEKAEQLNRELSFSLAEVERLHALSEQANRIKSQFLDNMSHELRTPLNGVLTVAELMYRTELSEEQEEYIDAAHRSGMALKCLVEDILSFSSYEAGELDSSPCPVKLDDFLQGVIAQYEQKADEKGISLGIEQLGEWQCGPTVLADRLLLAQAIKGLISNAIKFTERGNVTLSCALERVTSSQFRLALAVSDTGIGIPRDELARIFDSFYQIDGSVTRRHGGIGLGLTMCYHIITLLGGALKVESVEGQGSCFSFRVCLPEVVDQLRGRSGCPRRIPGPLHVLVVDDNRVNLLVTRRMMEKEGCIVDTAMDGLEAIERVEEKLYDLILMDCQMPQLDGYGATRAIRDLEAQGLQHTPIVALTANALPRDRLRCLQAGMDGYMSKPLILRELLDELAFAAPCVLDQMASAQAQAAG